MKKALYLLLTGTLLISCGATKTLTSTDPPLVATTIDLINVVDDKVLVTVDPGAFITEEVTFYIPKTVPGTYSIDDYGQYIEGFKAIDYDGNELSFRKTDKNTWQIASGRSLDKVSYWVNDTYDTERILGDAVFSPAGTNILAGETFMLNLHGFIGYFESLQEIPYEIRIQVPEFLKSTTSLMKKDVEGNLAGIETFMASRYFEVIDSPILYTKEDKASFNIKDISVNLSVFSPNKVYTAMDFKDSMQQMMEAQKNFLGEIDGTREYNILLHLSTMNETDAMGFGALEHHTSTVVVFPEQLPQQDMEEAMVDVVSHEFFHIVTPLNVHSREIHFFDFNDPKMSMHLWMYEGTTEYFANLFQINQGLIEEAKFYQRIMDKINNAKSFADTISFTEMSKNILVSPYKENYGNVYEKGALINMALDLTLRELSDGEKGVLWLMKALSEKYDANTPFEDELLIDEIVALTYPEVRTFFETHVKGDKPIPYSEYLAKVGLTTRVQEEQSGYFLRGKTAYIDIDQSNNDAIFIRKGIELNSFLKDLGAQGGDVIKSINDTAINLEAIRPIIGESFGWTPDTEIKMVVQRGDEEVTLAGAVGTPKINVETIVPDENAGEQETRLREAWLRG